MVVGTVVIIALGVAIGLGALPGDGNKIFSEPLMSTTSGYYREIPSYSSSPAGYTYTTRWITVDNSYIDPKYKQLFQKLDYGTKNSSEAEGFNINYTSITPQEWASFCQLTKESDEFNTYAGQLLYSQYDNINKIVKENSNENNQLNTIATQIQNRYEYSQILKLIGLKEQNVFNIEHKENSFKLTDWFKYGKIFDAYPAYFTDQAYENLLKSKIQTGDFSDNAINMESYVNNFCDVIKKTVKGSLEFWSWKQNRKYDEYKGKQPLRLSTNKYDCWIHAGAQLLIALTAGNDLSQLGNWGKFIKKLANIQANDLNSYVIFPNELRSFCSSSEFDFNEITKGEIDQQLSLLDKDGTAQTAINILLKIFPKLKAKKFDTKNILYTQPCDPILSDGVASDKKTYLPADTAIRHLIPALNNINAGVGSDPIDIADVANQYAEYRLKYSLNDKLMIYELRGLALSEHSSTFEKIPANETFDKQERYKINAAKHARAVVKLDGSSHWHYCDSNKIYFMEDNIRNIFYNKHSIADYFKLYKNNPPANHADLLVYSLVTK